MKDIGSIELSSVTLKTLYFFKYSIESNYDSFFISIQWSCVSASTQNFRIGLQKIKKLNL